VSVAFLLAVRADTEELEFVNHGLKAAVQGNAVVELGHRAMVDLYYTRTAQANQVMVMSVIAVGQQFEPGDTISKIKPFHHCHALQQMD